MPTTQKGKKKMSRQAAIAVFLGWAILISGAVSGQSRSTSSREGDYAVMGLEEAVKMLGEYFKSPAAARTFLGAVDKGLTQRHDELEHLLNTDPSFHRAMVTDPLRTLSGAGLLPPDPRQLGDAVAFDLSIDPSWVDHFWSPPILNVCMWRVRCETCVGYRGGADSLEALVVFPCKCSITKTC